MVAKCSVASTPCTVFWFQRNLLLLIIIAVDVIVKCRALSIIHVQIIWFADYPCTIISY
jgi:hypothetical protein